MSWKRCECGRRKDFEAERCRPCAHAAGSYTLWTRDECRAALRAWVARFGRAPSYNSDWARAGYGHPSARTCARLFGSWRRFLATEGLKPWYRGKGRITLAPRESHYVPVGTLREALNEYRSQGGTLGGLAERARVDQGYLSHISRGVTGRVSRDIAERILCALDRPHLLYLEAA